MIRNLRSNRWQCAKCRADSAILKTAFAVTKCVRAACRKKWSSWPPGGARNCQASVLETSALHVPFMHECTPADPAYSTSQTLFQNLYSKGGLFYSQVNTLLKRELNTHFENKVNHSKNCKYVSENRLRYSSYKRGGWYFDQKNRADCNIKNFFVHWDDVKFCPSWVVLTFFR